MTAVAEALLEGLNENAVDFRDNYDGTLTEPVVLPATFPNLLANGSSGIAVGMATNIPPHNIAELCDACLHLIRTPDARDDTLLKYVPGPDFPTGGDRCRTGGKHRAGLSHRARHLSGCAAVMRSRIWAEANGRSWSRKSPTRCRNPS